ncbi:MAG: hypothetical protein JWO69_796 [Thermoleophilia bacterium]|nr:hypothetical protein [Thermoleophilia bacterium]
MSRASPTQPATPSPSLLLGVERARAQFDASAPIIARYETVGGEKRLELSPPESRALVTAVDAVLTQGADVQPIVNRSLDHALGMLTSGAALPTRGGRTDPADEVRLGMLASTTGPGVVYGSVHIASTLRDAATGAQLVNTGQTLYGPVAIVLKPETLERATLTPRDSLGADHLIPPEELARAFAESLTHRALSPATLRDILLGAGISGGSANDPSTGFQAGTPEAQFYGGIRPADVREIRLSAAPSVEAERAIRNAAARWNIPVVLDNKVLPPGELSEWGETVPGIRL